MEITGTVLCDSCRVHCRCCLCRGRAECHCCIVEKIKESGKCDYYVSEQVR